MDNGEIVIDKNLTIKKADTAATAVLDANKDAGGKPKHRIFKVGAGKTLTLQNLKLKGGMAEGTGDAGLGGAIFASGATVNITNCTLTGNEANSGGGIYAKKITVTPSAVTISGCTIGGTTAADANKAADYGGGIYIDEGCSLTLKDGAKVIGNTAVSGGGVYNKGGSFEMTGGEIKSNTANYGGGNYVKDAGATLTMSGGTISENKAEKYSTDSGRGGDGGGVYIDGAKFTLKLGTTISNNTADKDGGGVTVFGGEFTMEGGVIQGNTVTGTSTVQNSGHAGGVDIVVSVMNMKGGEIKNNTAKNGGGGVSIALSGASNSVLNMSGGTISGNMLTNSAGTGKGVEFFTGSTTHGSTTYYTIMKMSGSAKVDTNNDVYLTNKKDNSNEIRMITVDGELTGTAPVACITPKNYSAGLQVLEAGTGVNLASEAGKFAVTPKSGTPPEYWGINNTGNLTQDKTSIFNAISNDQIKAAESSMNSTPITDRKTALEGKLILYKTNLNNYGIMRVTAVDNTGAGYIRIDYKTFNSDGSIKKSENNRKVNGTWPFDLDEGKDSGGDFDFWLKNLNSTDAGRHFMPANGAKFYVLP